MSKSPEYTPEKPLVINSRTRHDALATRAEILGYLKSTGAVKVWHNLEIGTGAKVWLTDSNVEIKPDWRAGDPVLIHNPDCIVVREPKHADFVTRTYMDLELFSLAAEQQGVTLTFQFQNVNGDWIDTPGPLDGGGFAIQVWDDSRLPRVAKRVVIHHTREAHNGNGFREGTEAYVGRLPIALRDDGDTFHGPGAAEGLARWLVRVDESALTSEMTESPDEPQVKPGYLSDMAGSFVEGGEPDEDHPGEKGYLIDGDFVPEDDYEAATEGFYNKPDGDFVHQEMCAVLARVKLVGAHRQWNRETRSWEILDAHGDIL